jgi:hypothetical protein
LVDSRRLADPTAFGRTTCAMPRCNLTVHKGENPGFLGRFVEPRRRAGVAAGQYESFPQNIAVILV